MEDKAWRRTSVALFATFCAAAVIALGVSAIFAPTALAAGNDVAEEAGMAREVASVDEGATASAEEIAAIGDEPKADTADQEIYAIFYDNPDKKSYTLVIQNGDTLDPAYPKPADDRVILVCGGESGWCDCGFWNQHRDAYEGRTTHAKVQAGVAPHSMDKWFEGFANLESLDLSGLDSSKVTSMHATFSGCKSLESLDLSKFDTADVTDMFFMFEDCSSLKTLTLPEVFNTSNVTDMRHMFFNCSALESLSLSDKFDTSRITDMSGMFSGCESLESLDLSMLDTSKVTDMMQMFSGCESLESLVFSDKFVTSWVTNMNFMFLSCASLKTLDLSKFDMARVKSVSGMFSGCDSLSSISLPVTGDFAKSGLSSWRDGKPLKWRNEKGEVFAADAIPARTAGTYTAVVVGSDSDSDSNGDGTGSGNGNGGDGDNSGSNEGNGGSNNGSGSTSPTPKRTVAFSEAVALPLDATGVAMDKDDIVRDLAKRFGSREGFPTDASSVAVTIMLGGKEVEAIDPTRAGTYEVTAVYSMPDGTERVIEAAYTVADPAAKAPVKSAARSATRLAQTGDEVAPAVPLATAALAACALAAAVAVRRRARG